MPVEGAVTARTLADALTELRATKEARSELSAQDKELSAKQDLLEQELIQLLDASGLDTALIRGVGRATVCDETVYNVADWEQFYGYVKDGDKFYLLQRRLSSTAVREEANVRGTPPPGLTPVTLRKLAFSKK